MGTLANQPPSGARYDPENDGTTLTSLGVQEHWNSAAAKQYSRNLGAGEGIELVSEAPPPPVFGARIVAPADGAVFTQGEAIALVAALSGATSASVEFFAGPDRLGEARAAPYTHVWAHAPAGNYALTARATAADNAVATSTAVRVTVRALTRAPPAWMRVE